MAQGRAVVKGVLSGDTILIVGNAKSGPPPTMQLSMASVKAPMMAMKSLSHEKEDEPYGFQAREALRRAIVGQVVDFKVEYEFNGRKYGRILLDGTNVAVPLLKEGLVKLMPKRGSNDASDWETLSTAESVAKDKELGVHGNAQRGDSVRTCIHNSPGSLEFDAEDFFKQNKGKTVDAIVESIRDGGCYRMMIHKGQCDGIPDDAYLFTPVLVAGIQCDMIKRGPDGAEIADGYALEAKHFVEMRLLNRDVQIKFETHDANNNFFVSVIHPKGNIAVTILKNGFAKVADWSARAVDSPGTLRAAQKEAQQGKLRKWKDYEPSTFVSKKFVGKVVEVVSGDCIVVKESETGEEKRLYMASLRSPKLGSPGNAQNGIPSRPDDPWAYECKEFCRRKLVGKKVNVKVEYDRDAVPFVEGGGAPRPSDSSGKMLYASLFFGQSEVHLGVALCAAGLARTSPHREGDERSEHYDDMVDAEKEAEVKKLGVHGKDSPVVRRWNDCVGKQNQNKSKAMENSLVRAGKIEAVVDHVFNGSRFKLRIEKQNLYIPFTLGGAKAPATAMNIGGRSTQAEPFSEEAVAFAREHLMQRDVTIQSFFCNLGGTHVGELFVKIDGKDRLFNEWLLEEGFADTSLYLDRMASYQRLERAEKKAQDARRRIWASEEKLNESKMLGGAEEEKIVVEELGKVTISHMNGVDEFFVQKVDSKVNQIAVDINNAIKDGKAVEMRSFSKGSAVLAKFAQDGQWYRARVESRTSTGAKVGFQDFGNVEEVSINDIRQLPPTLSFTALAPQAIRCALSGLAANAREGQWDVCRYMQEWAAEEPAFLCKSEKIVYGKKFVILTPSSGGMTVNEDLVKEGMVRMDRRTTTSIRKELEKQQDVAKKGRFGVWQYGDAGEDDEDDYY